MHVRIFLNYLSVFIISLCIGSCNKSTQITLFNGKNLEGWNGSMDVFRVEDGKIIGGNLKAPLKKSHYLCTERLFDNFKLSVKTKFHTNNYLGNGGISFRTARVPNSNEVGGYQADIGSIAPKFIELFSEHTPENMEKPFSLWGSLVDECRSDTSRYPNADFFPVVFLSIPERGLVDKVVQENDWNTIEIIAKGKSIEIKVNEHSTANFTEDMNVAGEGCICLQAHSGDPYEVYYKDVILKEL